MLAVSHTGRMSGAEAVLARTLRAAAERGWEVSCATPRGPLAERVRQGGHRHVAIPELTLPAGPRPLGAALLAGRTVTAALRLREACAGADVVLNNGLLSLPALSLARPPVPVAWIVHDVVRRADRMAVLRRFGGVVDVAIPVSEAAAGPVRARGLPVRVVRNGTPWPVAPAASDPPGPRVVGCSALLTPWKGQDVLLEAVARLDRPDVAVELLGGRFPKDGPFVAALERRAAQPDLAGRVRFLGHVDDPLARMRAWTVAVSASVDPEAGPLSLIEAMSIGLPVVGSDLGGAPEVVDGAGLLVPAGDPDALARCLARLLDDPALRRRCAAAGRRRVGEELTLDRQLGRLLDEIEAVTRPAGAGDTAATQAPVVVVVPDFEPATGGTVRQVGNQARAVAARGRPVTVLTRRLHASWPRRELRDGIEVVRVGPGGRGRLPEKLSVVAVAAWLYRTRRHIGVVHVVMYADFALSAWAAGLGASTVVTWAARGDATDVVGPAATLAHRLQRALRRRVLARCRHVALTPTIARELAELGLASTVEVIPVPVDGSWFRPPSGAERRHARRRLGLAADELVVVYTGHLRALKCVDHLVEAFGRFRRTGRPGHLLLVGGDRGAADDRGEQLRDAVRQGGLDRDVTFAGPVDDVRPYLWAGDVFVLPSSREGLPNSLLEAMACGLACVAPASAAGEEILTAGCGVVPPGNGPGKLFDALVRLAEDPRRRQGLGAAATVRAGAFHRAGVTAAHERLYDGVAQGHPSRPDRHPAAPGPARGARAAGAAEALRVVAGGRLRTPGAIVLAYHDVGDDPSNRTDYYVSPAQLRDQLTAAVRWGLRFVDLGELTDAVLAGAPLDGLAAIVFDDSLVGVHHHAVPVLAELGLPATVFAVSGALGASPPWWPGAARVMTAGELAEVAALGFGVASHTRSHPSLPSLGPAQLREELTGSRRALEDLVGRPADLLAYPYGHHDPAVRHAATDAGYRAAFSFLNGRITGGLDRYRLPRLNMWSGQGRARLAYHLARSPASWPPTQLEAVHHQEAGARTGDAPT